MYMCSMLTKHPLFAKGCWCYGSVSWCWIQWPQGNDFPCSSGMQGPAFPPFQLSVPFASKAQVCVVTQS